MARFRQDVADADRRREQLKLEQQALLARVRVAAYIPDVLAELPSQSMKLLPRRRWSKDETGPRMDKFRRDLCIMGSRLEHLMGVEAGALSEDVARWFGAPSSVQSLIRCGGDADRVTAWTLAAEWEEARSQFELQASWGAREYASADPDWLVMWRDEDESRYMGGWLGPYQDNDGAYYYLNVHTCGGDDVPEARTR